MSTTVDLGKITASVTVGNTTTGAAGTNASVSNSGTTQDAVLNFTIPRGAQGVQGPQGSTGPQGPAGPTGPQGPMGDVAVITPEQQAAFTMYSETGQNTNGPMTQKAVTDALENIAASGVSYDNSQSGLAAENVQGALDEIGGELVVETDTKYNPANEYRGQANLKNVLVTTTDNGFTAEVIVKKGTSTTVYIVDISCRSLHIGKTYRMEFDYVSEWNGSIQIRDNNYNFDASTLTKGYTIGTGHISVVKTINYESAWLTILLPQNTAVGKTLTISNLSIEELTSVKDLSYTTTRIKPYLYNDLKILELGKSFNKNEAVRTTGEELLRISKPVTMMNLTAEVAVGDLCYNGNNTYKALKAVKAFTLSPSTPYVSGDYAIGSFTEYTLEITAGSSAGNISVNGTVIETTGGESAADIASAIASSITIDGWTLTASDNTVLVRCNAIGNNITTISFEDTDSTGVVISGTSTPSATGTNVVRVYDGTAWNIVTIANYATSSVWDEISIDELIGLATVQNAVSSYFKKSLSLTGHPFTGASGTDQIIYRGFPVKKGTRYTVYIKAVGVSQMGQRNNNKLNLRNEAGEAIATEIIFGSGDSLINGITKTFIPTKDADSAALWMLLYSGAWAGVELICTISWTDYATSIEEKVKYEEEEELRKQMEDVGTYPYQVSENTLSWSAERYYICGEFGSDYGKAIYVSSTDNKITGYINCEGVTKIKVPLIKTKSYNAGFVFYDAYKNPILDNYSHYRRGSNESSKYQIIDVPEGAVYFRNSMWRQAETYTFYTDVTLPDVKISLNDVTEELEGLNSKINIPEGLAQYGYEGEKISVYHKFASERVVWGPNGQGSACYGNYLFIGQSGSPKLRVVDMAARTTLSNAIDLGSYAIADTHANSLSFSNQFYEEGDEFPLLYIPSGSGNGSNPTEFHVYGVRILRNGSNFTASIVKTIVLSATGSWTEFICAGTKAWIKNEYSNATWKWYCISMPALDDSSVINLDELTPSFTTGKIASSCQGHFYYGGRIYIPEASANGYLFVLDTITGEIVSKLNLGYVTNVEPEGFFLYDNHFHLSCNGGGIYKLYFD